MRALKDDGLGDLVDVAANRLCRIARGPGKGRFGDVDRFARRIKSGAHAFHAFAHGVFLETIGTAIKGVIDAVARWGNRASMTLASQLSRLPRPYDPDLAAEARHACGWAQGDIATLIEGAAGTSPFLKGLIMSHAEWLEVALADPDGVAQQVLADLRDPALISTSGPGPALRQAKARLALLAALADLGGVWPLERVTGLLTDLADTACDVALRHAIAPLLRRGKLPGQTEDDLATAAGLTVLAMGKMGAGELNYSSDIDLICLFDEQRFDPDDYFEARTSFVKATRQMSTMLNDRTGDGYVFRTDLRLRPDPAVTPVCIAMEAAERYYESLGRTWERAAYIKARPAAGDIAAGERFLETLRPFVWRRHLDFAAIEDAHDMRLRIRDHKGLGGPMTVPGHDMKLGRGGIREIEFFTQTRQIIAGGRDPDLRVRGTVEGLQALAAKGWVPDDVAQSLTGHYRAHREVEHRIQMIHDAQTHKMPASAEGIDRIACLMGTDAETLQAEVRTRLEEVHELTEGFFAAGSRPARPANEDAVEIPAEMLERWQTYPALRSPRALQIFERLRPQIAECLAKSAKPEEALSALDSFLAGLPAGVQLFSLFQANPQLIDLLIDIVGTSSALAAYLGRNSSVLDAVIGGDFFADWPGHAVLTAQLTARLEGEEDYERQLDAARRWAKDWHFRIGVHHLRGLVDGATAGQHYTDLADAVLAALWPVVVDQFARRHGPPPGRGAVIVGMGSLGAGQLSAQSDLDMIVIYDPQDVEMSEGRRPLASRQYYARLTQAMITAITAPMAEGRLYEVDMRLRPSGNQGPVATSLKSFRDYQLNEAWVWEHLALTRARVVTGNGALAADIETFRSGLIGQPRETAAVLSEVRDMRRRVAQAKHSAGILDAKTGRGRMMDIELLAQAGALLAGQVSRDVPAGLAGAVARGLLKPGAARTLERFYAMFHSIQTASRLLSPQTPQLGDLGEAATDMLCRAANVETASELAERLEAAYLRSAALVDAAIGQDKEESGDEG